MFKKIIHTGLTKGIGLLITFIIGVIISRVYGSDGKGQITLLLLIPTIISIYSSFSIGEGFLFYIGKNKISKSVFDKFLLEISLYLLPLMILFYHIAYFFVPKYEYYFFPQLLLLISFFYNNILKFSIRGALSFKTFNITQVLEPLFIFIFLIALILLQLNVRDLIWSYAISYFLIDIYLYLSIKSKLQNVSTNISIKALFNYSFKVHFFRVLNFTESKFDLLIIGYFLNDSNVGIYSVAVSITLIFQTIVQASISTVLLPTLVNSNLKQQIIDTLKYFKLSLFSASLFLFLLILIGKQFIHIVYGSEFSSAFLPMIIILIGALFKSPTACINAFFKSSGKPEELYKTSIYSVIINIVLCFVLIPKYGIIGAAVSSSISYFLYGIIMIIKFKKTSNLKLHYLMLNVNDIKNIIRLIKLLFYGKN